MRESDILDNFKSAYSSEPNLVDILSSEGERQDRANSGRGVLLGIDAAEPQWRDAVRSGASAAARAYETYGHSSQGSGWPIPMAAWEEAADKRARIDDFKENVVRASYNFTKTTFRPPGQFGTDFGWLVSSCDSPIEVHILPWLVINDYWPVCSGVAWADKYTRGISDKFPVVVCPQVAVAHYRLDFGIFVTFKEVKKLFAFECDGAAFHEETRDHERDMFLLKKGVQTIRASGTEIYNDPAACARRVSNAVANWSKSI